MLATTEAIRDRLTDGWLVRRWAENPSGFVVCRFWLVECFAVAGKVDEAETWFDHLLDYTSELGLFAEEIDPPAGRSWSTIRRRSPTSGWSTRPGG